MSIHAFQGYNGNSWLRTGLQRVFARSSPFTRGVFYLSFVRRPLHVRRTYVWRAPRTRLGPPHKPSLRRRSDLRRRLSHRKAPKPPIWPLPLRRRASSTSGAPGRSVPLAPKPRNAEPTAGKPALVNSTHAIQAKLSFLPNLYCIYRSPFVRVVRSW
jgi:hypothetical protein